MKKSILFFLVFFSIWSCNNNVVEKPKKLISEDEMVNIIYDMSLLDALKTQNVSNVKTYPSSTELLKKKYKIDSITFAKNAKYYAADVKNYKAMYDKVQERLNKQIADLSKPTIK